MKKIQNIIKKEKDLINIELENKKDENQVDRGTSSFATQMTTVSKSTGRTIPKRKPKQAVDSLILADYKCEYNPEDRTFTRKNGKQYTEPHHLIPISKYREFDRSLDVKENIVSLLVIAITCFIMEYTMKKKK